MLKHVCIYFLTFVLYSFMGWVLETLLYALRDKKFVKRGFLFGPFCPIYGFASLICIVVLYHRVTNVFLIFLYGLLLCGTVEYVTHFLMEKLFHAMWWDYSDRMFNIKGRVYLKGLLFFGVGALLIIRVFQPLFYMAFSLMSDKAIYITSFVLYSILIFDLATTLSDLKGTVSAIKSIQRFAISKAQNSLDITDDKIRELLESVKETSFVSGMIEKLRNNNSFFIRVRKSYPQFTLKHYKSVFDIVNEKENDKENDAKEKSDIKHYGTADSLPGSEEDVKEIEEAVEKKEGKIKKEKTRLTKGGDTPVGRR
ncbi:MAG: putative ABC transporter permease [Clostridiales bacterium]|nr:putative ABC transporter permease [Clostridiales bacterium]